VGKYEVFVDKVTLELVVPAVVQVLLPHQISDANVAELSGLCQSRRRRCLARPGCPCHQYVRLPSTSYATVLLHGTLASLLLLLLYLITNLPGVLGIWLQCSCINDRVSAVKI